MQLESATISVLVFAIVLGLLPFWRATRKEDRNALNPAKLFLIYLIVQLSASGLISVCVVQLMPFTLDPHEHPAVYFKAAIVYVLGILAFNIGYWGSWRKVARLPSRMRMEWPASKQAMLATLLILAGYAAVSTLVVTSGGLAAMFENREEFRAYGIVGKGFLIYPMTQGLTLGCLLTLDLLLRRPPSAWRSILTVLIVVAAIVPAVVTGFRGFILMPLVVFSIYYNYNVRSIYTAKGGLALGAILVFFVGYGVWREIPPNIDPVSAVSAVAEERPALFFGPLTRSAGLEVSAQIIDKMDRDPTIENEWFWPGVYESLTIPIPMAVWPDKPEPSNFRSGEIFFLNEQREVFGTVWDNPGGISDTLIGWGYWQANVAGVMLGGFFFGWLLRRLVATQSDWGSLGCVRIGFAMLAPPLILACEEPQLYLSTTFSNLVILFLVASWMTAGVRRSNPTAIIRS